jgi:hypothetical protein
MKGQQVSFSEKGMPPMKTFPTLAVYAAVATALCAVAGHSQTRIPITLTDTIPSSVENSTQKFFRPFFEEAGFSCGNAMGIAFTFTYELNFARNTAANTGDNQYAYLYTYNFLNGGSTWSGTSHMYVNALTIAKENGIPNLTDWGGLNAGSDNYQWMNGYDKYYRAMQNRVETIDSFSIIDSLGLRKLKQWIYDHGNGSKSGGLANYGVSVFAANMQIGWQFTRMTSGPKSGQYLCLIYGTDISGDHAQTAIGYNDSVRYDFNKDGKFTNSGGMANWEVGALHVANGWSTNSDAGTDYWCPYRLLALPQDKGGLRNGNRATIITAQKTYKPEMTFKISLTHSRRKEIALSVGVAASQNAQQPEKIRKFQDQFTFAGGDLPLCGQNASSTIEIGLDVSDLLDSLAGSRTATFFLIVQSQGGTAGSINSLSLMDYTSGSVNEIKSTQTNVKISANAKTLVKVSTDVTKVAQEKVGPVLPGRVEVRKNGNLLQIRGPWNASARVSVLTANGEARASALAAAKGSWLSLPSRISAGSYIVRYRQNNGRFAAQRISVY